MDTREERIRAALAARDDYHRALAGVSAASTRYGAAVAALEALEKEIHRPGARARVAAALDVSWQQVARLVKRQAPDAGADADTTHHGVDPLSL